MDPGLGRDSITLKDPFPHCLGAGLRRVFPWLAPALFLGLFFFYPLVRILGMGIDPSLLLDLATLRLVLRVSCFTLYQAVLSTFFTLLIGLPAAYLFAHYEFPGKSLLRVLTAIPFMLPTVVVAAGFNALLGPRGWINLALMNMFGLALPPVNFLHTLWAILLAHVFYNTTIVIRIVGHALAHLDPRMAQAARALGADSPRTFRFITLPLLRPSLLAATLLVFLFDFTSFGVILLLGGVRYATLEVEIYIQALHMLNLPVAALLSLIQLVCTLIFSILYSRMVTRVVAPVAPRSDVTYLHRARSLPERFFMIGMAIFLIALFVLPMLSVPLRSISRLEAGRGERTEVQYGLTTNYYRELFVNRRGSLFYVPPIRAAYNSLGYACITMLLSLLIGLPAASALARPTRLERWLDPLLMLPLGASAVTLGLGYVITFSRPPFNLLASPWLVPLAHTLIALPFVIRSLQPALASIPARLQQAASVLGASPVRTWLWVDWPIISRAAVAAAVFAFAVSLGEFGATSMVVRPEYPTLPIAIARYLSRPGGLNYGQAMAMATILMTVCGVGIILIERLRLPGTDAF